MGACVVVDGPHVDHRSAPLMARLDLKRMERSESWNVAEDARSTPVQRTHAEEVRRVTRHTPQESVRKSVCSSEPQKWIAASLGPNGGNAFGASRGGTERSGAVGWIYHHVVAKRQDAFVQRSVQLVRETGRVLVAEQVRPGDSAGQQAAATEQCGRFFGTASV